MLNLNLKMIAELTTDERTEGGMEVFILVSNKCEHVSRDIEPKITEDNMLGYCNIAKKFVCKDVYSSNCIIRGYK